MSKVILRNVRINFARLFKAEGFKGSEDNKKYSAQFILDADDKGHKKALKELRAAIDKVGQEKWGAKWKGGKMKVSGYCLKSADEGLQDEQFVTEINVEDDDGNVPEYLQNAFQVAASETKRPVVRDADKTPLTEEDAKIYDGCYVTAIISLWAQDNKWGKRINANLLGVQFKAFGTPLGDKSESVDDDDFDGDDFDDDDDL